MKNEHLKQRIKNYSIKYMYSNDYILKSRDYIKKCNSALKIICFFEENGIIPFWDEIHHFMPRPINRGLENEIISILKKYVYPTEMFDEQKEILKNAGKFLKEDSKNGVVIDEYKFFPKLLKEFKKEYEICEYVRFDNLAHSKEIPDMIKGVKKCYGFVSKK